MQNSSAWVPTKYVFQKNRLIGSRNPAHLSVSSRLMTDITASFYQRAIPQHVTGRLADLGCGNVPFYALYRQYVSENICVDWPNSRHQNQYLDVACDLNEPLAFADGEFDTIIISEVLEHISEPEIIWREMSRIIKPGGKILLSVPFFYKIHEAPFDFYRYTEFCLRNFASKNQLNVLELTVFGGLPEIFTDILSKKLMIIPVMGKASSMFVQWMCTKFVQTGFGKKLSQKTGKEFPLGYFMIVQKPL